MSTVINMTVTPRRVLTLDSSGKVLVTPEILNDMANPIVSGVIDETSILPSLAFSVGAKVASSILTTIQAKIGGSNYAQRVRINAWLTDDAATCAISTTAPTTTPTGFSGNMATLVTDANGAYALTITNTTSHTWYLCAEINGRVYVSEAIAF